MKTVYRVCAVPSHENQIFIITKQVLLLPCAINYVEFSLMREIHLSEVSHQAYARCVEAIINVLVVCSLTQVLLFIPRNKTWISGDNPLAFLGTCYRPPLGDCRVTNGNSNFCTILKQSRYLQESQKRGV